MRTAFIWMTCAVIVTAFLGNYFVAQAGSLDSPAAPDNSSSSMYTLNDLYQRLNEGTTRTKRSGSFAQPGGTPTSGTMYTLDQIMSAMPAKSGSGAQAAEVLAGKTFWGLSSGSWGEKTGTMAIRTLSADNTTIQAGYYAATDLSTVEPDLLADNIATNVTLFGIAGCAETNSGGGSSYPAPVGKTGQTTVYRTGDDGSHQAGVEGPDSRFTVINDYVFQDNLTGLMWTKNSAMNGAQMWNVQVEYCNNLDYGGYDDWRMPNIKEMLSLIAIGRYNPALPAGTPFSNYANGASRWTSSYYAGRSDERLVVGPLNGTIGNARWYRNAYVWPVRGTSE